MNAACSRNLAGDGTPSTLALALVILSLLMAGCAMTPTQKKIGTAVLIIATTSVALSQHKDEQSRSTIPGGPCPPADPVACR